MFTWREWLVFLALLSAIVFVAIGGTIWLSDVAIVSMGGM